MKKTICLLVLLAFIPAMHADNKKKKQQQGGSGALPALGGGGAKKASGGGGVHLPGISRGGGGGASGNATKAPRRPSVSQSGQPAGGPGMSANNPLSHHSSTGPANAPGARATGSSSSNPLLRRSGQPHTGASNPLTNKGQAAGNKGANPLTQSNRAGGGKNANPLTQNSNQAKRLNATGNKGAQNAMTGRNANPMRGNNRRLGANLHNQNARALRGGSAGRISAAAHTARANYRVRPYREVFHNYRAIRHDRVWYTTHYDRVVIVGGGYYYWDAGYWYPAWGYDPAFSVYVYDGPIYSYANLPPDQVIVNVQTELQDQGYYTGEVDGQLGPQTREAIAAYQADHNLEVTSAIDEPTVESLGLADADETGST